MKIPIIVLACLSGAAAHAGTYPVSGRWGPSVPGQKGAIDCSGKRVIGFNGDTRTDSNGGVPGDRNRSVTADGPQQFRVVDEFTNGQVNNAHTTYTLRLLDADHIEMRMQGGTLKLQRCKYSNSWR